jgi:hypothetical protein
VSCPMPDHDVIAEIENAFRNFGLKDTSTVGALRQATIQLVWLCLLPPSPPTRFLQKVGRAEARKELDELADLAEKLIRRFWTLNGTAINTLGGSHIGMGTKP